MKLLALNVAISSLLTISVAIPHNQLVERQRDKTFTITCLGPQCTDYPPTSLDTATLSISIPGGIPNPITTTTKPRTTSTSTTKKTSTTSKYTPPPQEPSTSKYTPPPTSKYTPPPPTSKYTPPPQTQPTKTTKPTDRPTTTGGEVGPSSTRCPVPLYYQCGGYYDGKPWTGCTKCVSGAKCDYSNDFYYQCVADE